MVIQTRKIKPQMKKYILDLSKPLLDYKGKETSGDLADTLLMVLHNNNSGDNKTQARKLGEIQVKLQTSTDKKLTLEGEDFKTLKTAVETNQNLIDGAKYQLLLVIDEAEKEADKPAPSGQP